MMKLESKKNLNIHIDITITFFLIFQTAIPSHALEDKTTLLKEADKLLNEETAQSVKRALVLYEKILSNYPYNYEALWKTAESYYYLGKYELSAALQKEHFKKCIDFNKKAIEVDNDSVEAHYWLGLCYGRYGEAVGMVKSILIVDDIKDEMNRVISIDPSYSNGGAYRVLGRIYNKLPWIMGGNNKKSLEYLKKAVIYGHRYPLNHLFLADTYLSMGKKQLVKQELKLVLEYTSNEAGLSEDEIDTRKRAERLLDDLRLVNKE